MHSSCLSPELLFLYLEVFGGSTKTGGIWGGPWSLVGLGVHRSGSQEQMEHRPLQLPGTCVPTSLWAPTQLRPGLIHSSGVPSFHSPTLFCEPAVLGL